MRLLKNFGIKEPLVPVVSRTSKNQFVCDFFEIFKYFENQGSMPKPGFFSPSPGDGIYTWVDNLQVSICS
jgi:hypothetical protein